MGNSLRTLWIPSTAEDLERAQDRLLGHIEGLTTYDVEIGSSLSMHTVLVENGSKKGGLKGINSTRPSRQPFATKSGDGESDTAQEGKLKGSEESSEDEGSAANIIPAHSGKPPLVMCHGFGFGVGGWASSFPLLRQSLSRDIYAIDWLGMGRSSRPDFNHQFTVQETEDYFIDALDRWREAVGVKEMILLGHSLGGYLAVCYSLKYPDRVKQLILASPVGIPPPPAGNPYLRKYNKEASKKRKTGSQEEGEASAGQPKSMKVDASGEHSAATDRMSGSGARPNDAESSGNGDDERTSAISRQIDSLPFHKRIMVKSLIYSFTALWSRGYTPQDIVRWAGPMGPLLLKKYTKTRFNVREDDDAVGAVTDEFERSQAVGEEIEKEMEREMERQMEIEWARDMSSQQSGKGESGDGAKDSTAARQELPTKTDMEALANYLYHISAARGSGEYSLGRLLLPFAYAKHPLSPRLPLLQTRTSFLYGEHDWMDYRAAEQARKVMDVPTDLIIVERAGHQIAVDNPKAFVEAVRKVIEEKHERPGSISDRSE